MSLILSTEDQSTLKAWAAPRCGVRGAWPDHAQAVGIIERDTGVIRAVWVIVHTYARHCDVHMASDGARNWATRNTLGGLFGYIFFVMKAEIVLGVVPASNLPSLIGALKIGFEVEGRLRGICDDGSDGVAISMHRDNCRWIKEQG